MEAIYGLEGMQKKKKKLALEGLGDRSREAIVEVLVLL